MPRRDTKLQIFFTADEAMALRMAAMGDGLTVGSYIRLRLAGKLAAKVEKPADPDKPAQGPVDGTLRARISQATGDKPIPISQVPALARKLGVSTKSIYRSINSMQASNRMVRVGDEFQFVKREQEL